MDNPINTNILESLILDSYQDLSSITESIMDIKMCENAYKLDMKSIMESNDTSLIDGRTERYNNDKATLIEKAKKKISEFLKYIRDKVVEFYNIIINFLKKSLNSDKMIIKKYKNCETVISVEGYKYTIDLVLKYLNDACENFKKYCINSKSGLNDDIVNEFRKTIVSSDRDVSKEEFESLLYKVLRSNNSNTETITGTVGDFCIALDYEKEIKSLYKLVASSKFYFEPKYINNMIDYEITHDDMTKSLEILNELKNTMLFTLNACKNAINERNTMIRQAIIDGVRDKENLNESYLLDEEYVYESVLDKYDIDEILESDLGIEYHIIEAYINNIKLNGILNEGFINKKSDSKEYDKSVNIDDIKAEQKQADEIFKKSVNVYCISKFCKHSRYLSNICKVEKPYEFIKSYDIYYGTEFYNIDNKTLDKFKNTVLNLSKDMKYHTLEFIYDKELEGWAHLILSNKKGETILVTKNDSMKESFTSVLDEQKILNEIFYLHQEVSTVGRVKSEKVAERISKMTDTELINSYNELMDIKSVFSNDLTIAKSGKIPSRKGASIATRIVSKILDICKKPEDIVKELSDAIPIVKLQIDLTKKEINKRGLKINKESFISVLDEDEFIYESVLDQEDDTFVSVLDM